MQAKSLIVIGACPLHCIECTAFHSGIDLTTGHEHLIDASPGHDLTAHPGIRILSPLRSFIERISLLNQPLYLYAGIAYGKGDEIVKPINLVP